MKGIKMKEKLVLIFLILNIILSFAYHIPSGVLRLPKKTRILVQKHQLSAKSSKQQNAKNARSITTDEDLVNEQLISEWEEEAAAIVEEDEEKRRKKLIETGEEDKDFHFPKFIKEYFKELEEEKEEGVAMEKLPIVVVLGRPNTGKSTIVNKISEEYYVRNFLIVGK
jgi:ribosome biogenesis GTPase A